jgi:glycosyltransferase involved in cell wall biosynthesis
MLLLARELRRTHDVQIFVLRPGGLFAGRPAELGIETRHLGWLGGPWRDAPIRYPVAAVRALINYVRLARRVDIVDAWLPAAYTIAGLAQPFVRAPALVAGRRVLSAELTVSPGRFRRFAAALAMRQVNVVVANSDAVARDAIEVEGLRPSRVRVIRNGVDVPAPARAEYRNEVRRMLGIRDGELVVGCVANYGPSKGLEAVIAVADRLRLEPANLRFVLVGEGRHRAVLEQQIAALGVADLVTLHGADPDAQRLYPAFDIVIHASETEGLPNAVLEAAAWGKPIVATDVGGTREIVRDRREALLVPPRDPEALARALREVVRNPEMGQELGRAARDRALEFSPQRLAEATARLYGEAIEQRQASEPGAHDTRRSSV